MYVEHTSIHTNEQHIPADIQSTESHIRVMLKTKCKVKFYKRYVMCLSLNVIFKLLNKTFNKQTARLCLHYPSVLHCDSTLVLGMHIRGHPRSLLYTIIAISKVSQLPRRSIMCISVLWFNDLIEFNEIVSSRLNYLELKMNFATIARP